MIQNTLKIADEVSLTLERKYRLPSFPLPERFSDPNDYLVHLAEVGARDRYLGGSARDGADLPAEVRERLRYELEVILKTGYAGYFLISWDFIRWAREEGIPVGPGRGSAAGSLVSYALGITDLDPLAHGLLFERFLNPERISMPDIDIDFCYERRGEVIEYVRRKYGRDAVGQIMTFGTMKSRAVIRDVGRVLGFEVGETDRIAKMIPNLPQHSYSVAEAVEKVRDVKALYDSDDRHRRLFDYSVTLEGLARHASVHAAGVVIAPGPLSDFVPICTQSKGARNGAAADGGDGAPDIVTQYDMTCLEDAGMLKMDFLGLKTLTVIQDAAAAAGVRTLDDIPLDDEEVYRMLASGGTAGVFQFESRLARDKLRAMRCDRFEDLVATNALIRPGPLDSGMTDRYIQRKIGSQPVSYPAPGLEEILEPTFGIIVYQEQVMLIAAALAGYSLGEADVLRKAMGKKDAALIRDELARFRERVVERGLSPVRARELASQIETFGRYGFNKSHSVAYSLISYRTAWLKRRHPAKFMAALLSSVLDKTDDIVRYIGECREIGAYHPRSGRRAWRCCPPDVNESGWKFTAVSDSRIRVGLGAIRGVGMAAVESILEAREEDGSFESFFEFLERTDPRSLNKRACEALIAAGALDSLGHRAQLLEGLPDAHAEVSARRQERELGQASLFGAVGIERPAPPLPAVPEWTERERLANEKEALGFFISGHPLDRFRQVVRAFDDPEARELRERTGESVEIACVVTGVARQVSRRDGSEWAKIAVETLGGTATVLAFRDVWRSHREVIVDDAVVLLKGKVSDRERDEDDPPVFLDDAEPLSEVRDSGRLAVRITLSPDDPLPGDSFGTARALVEANAGPAPVEVAMVPGAKGAAAVLRSRSLRVSARPETIRALEGVFGRGRVGLAKAG